MSAELLKHQAIIDRYLGEIAAPSSAYSFVNIFIWQDFFRFDIVEIDGHLCVFAADDAGTFLYLPPLAKAIVPDVVEKCFERMTRLNNGRGVARIENVLQQQLVCFSEQKYKSTKKGYDYLYYRKDLADLKGDAFKSKRNAMNHFVKHHRSEYEFFESSMVAECEALYDRWAQDKTAGITDEMYRMMLQDNRLVHRQIFENFRALGLIGRVVKVAGRIVAYTFGYFLNRDTFCDLAEIADPQYKSAATYLFWLLCNDQVLKDIKFINVMDDMVPENVNRTKLSFRPAMMLPSYIVTVGS
jgi:hypothetical protein